ncbi:MAG: helix-turn-helix domain-containing protein [Candidatus Marinimicrobia bacterium]|jgi:excisionase family DNA binding protein|nr:helix-turn-helix domain-containing protein [Candidatus Neomarinimicrobiota bacterium]MDD5540136.1 helix-turn-helix domain-containing protein [Candidatus Neomarinimicrobiota bacterium]
MKNTVCPFCGSIVPENRKTLTVREAAHLLKVSGPRIRQMLAEGKLPGAIKRAGAWHIPEGELKLNNFK